MADPTITLTRKQARAVIDALGNDTEATGTFFTDLVNEMDAEQAVEPEDREGITIKIIGTEM